MALVASLLYCSYSYSEIVNDISPNAAINALNWTMTNIIPQYTGLKVNAVSYEYTVVKKQSDNMIVNVQNKDTRNNSYIFRSSDDWSGLRGNSITKLVPVANIPGTYWGPGEISVEGNGEVKNASVKYKYTYDTCANTKTDPKCPGYVPPVTKEVIDPTDDDMIKKTLADKVYKEVEKQVQFEMSEKKKKEEIVKKVIKNSLISEKDAQRLLEFEMMNNIPGYNMYTVAMPGGVYNDVLKYPEKYLPDNRRARGLGLAQERMHNTMVDSQYNK